MGKAIMIQGTMSNAGKSFLAAGLCRVLKQDGFRVAPFKSQNMALNSFITREGLEMGRAQVVQAEAAGIEPRVDMNPILLKPTSDSGSQVIVGGVPLKTMGANEYFAFKKSLVPEVKKAYQRLAKEFDVIVIEGAGSPAEINLRQDDIVNMGMAEIADAPVLLAGDIDRGGVFAQLYGTMALLADKDKARVKGLVINKFRGDKAILDPGLLMLQELCGVPVLGVVPYADVDIEDEDSLGRHLCSRRGGETALVEIAVLRFPRISNFTDFQVFSCFPEVNVHYVDRLETLGNPDLVILPGTKNTIEDLLWMRKNGLEASIKKLAAKEVPVFGICGGFQMLGEWVWDPSGVETKAFLDRPVGGLSLLPVRTVFEKEKTRTRMTGSCAFVDGIFEDLSGMEIEGYEIHMGKTECAIPPLAYLMEADGSHKARMDGCQKGNIYGTYIHGFFDKEGVAASIVAALLKRKGLSLSEAKGFSYAEHKEQQYERLGALIRDSLSMEAIYDMIGIDR